MWNGENLGVGPPEKYVLNERGIMDGYIIHPFKLYSIPSLLNIRVGCCDNLGPVPAMKSLELVDLETPKLPPASLEYLNMLR